MSVQCAAGTACRKPHIDSADGHREGGYLDDGGVLCPTCLQHIGTAIRQLPRDWAELRDALGEQAANPGTKIRSTPTPAMPISARKESLMSAIFEITDFAAAIVADALHTEQPTARRKPPQNAEPGSLAVMVAERIRPDDEQLLNAAIAITEPNLDVLAAAGAQDAMVWKSPRRCPVHAAAIDTAEADLARALAMPDVDEASQKQIRAHLRGQLKTKRDQLKQPTVIPAAAGLLLQHLNDAYRAAGRCDDCGAWYAHGQARDVITMTGIQVALELVDLHNQTRAELGKTKLRHRYAMPCPRCGGRVGRDDGQTIVNCDGCDSSWTEREYKFLAGLILDERQDMEITRYLLAEAYWRLDKIREGVEGVVAMKSDVDGAELIDLGGAGRVVADGVLTVLAGHKSPRDRAIATDKKAAEQRQGDEDTWQWGERPETYKPPKRKPRPERRPVEHPVAAGSLSTLIDIDTDVILNGDQRCPDCNLIHAGEC